jgi:phosphoserine phosphatase RsbU/P
VNSPLTGPERLLIVDDEEPLAKVMERTLRSRGLESDIALTAAEARVRFESNAYALVLLDVRLPDESGYGLLEELRSKRPETAVVMVSGVDDPELGKAAVEHGAYAYLVKPVGATQLYLTVINALRRRTMEREYRANLLRLGAMVDERAHQMRLAAELQRGMLPGSPFSRAGFELAAHFTAAREISGDFYDWYEAGEGGLVFTLGDVMGKGLPAALLMATARAALRGSSGIAEMSDGIKLAADVMAAAFEVNHAYVTAFHCAFDPASGGIQYVDAGHGHARLLRASGGQETLPSRSAPLGIFPDSQFIVGTAVLNPGDSLVVFSDGLLDLRPDLATKDVPLPFEVRRAATAQQMVDILAQGAGDHELADDVTVLALKRAASTPGQPAG